MDQYHANLSQAADYLTTRGFTPDGVRPFRLGVVDEHAQAFMVGRLSIPYLSPSGVLGIKYRCLQSHDCKEAGDPKYLYDDGEEPRLFNAGATLRSAPLIFICEGELDAIAVQSLTGLPAVAVPGAQMWDKHRYWARCFAPFPLVVIPADGDNAGKQLAKAIGRDLPQLRVVHMPNGADANDVLRTEGVDGFLKRCDLEEYCEEV